MTCIVSFLYNNEIILAGDKSGSNGFLKVNIKEPKVFHKKDFMIGYCGSFRMGQILKYVWEIPKRKVDQTTENYIYIDIITSIKKCFKDNGFGDEDKNKFGNFILCYENRIFEVQQDMSILEHEMNIVCIGSGEYHAVAAVQVLMEYEKDVEKILGRVFKIVSSNIVSVSSEFDYITSKDKKEE